jgi:hypothetical protein
MPSSIPCHRYPADATQACHGHVKDVRRLARASSRDLRGTGGRQSELFQSIGHASAQGATLRSPEADLLQGRTARERPDVQRLVVLKVPQRADSESALPALKSTLERRWRCGDEYL